MTALSGADHRIIARARALSDAAGLEAVRSAAADSEITTYAEAYGVARYLLGELAAIAERAGGGEDQAAADTRRLDRIRVVLAKFDWEHDDRQYALETIERITEGGIIDAG